MALLLREGSSKVHKRGGGGSAGGDNFFLFYNIIIKCRNVDKGGGSANVDNN